MGEYGFDPDKRIEHRDDDEIFKEARLERAGLEKSQWPAQIDRAALDIQYDIAVGESDGQFDIGGEIGSFNFHWATGEFYVEGLQAMVGQETSVAEILEEYDADKIGKVAYRLNEFRHELESIGQSMDIDRAIEALVEKQATSALDTSAKRGRHAGAGLRQLKDTGSVADLTLTLFSDPRVDSYAQALLENLTDQRESDELLSLLDEPIMTTPLWKHQRRAITEWIDHDQQGYVDMATATGKTVLGLAAIAYRYAHLHPADTHQGIGQYTTSPGESDSDRRPRVLIVAGNELLLKQWRDEFDEHLDIPKDRTEPVDSESGATIELGWGDIEFRTAQALLDKSLVEDYDLVILDEAHRYSRGSESGRGWGDLFAALTEQSNALLAMSGSVDGGWAGDAAAKNALEDHLERCIKFGVPEARDQGVIADFSWQIHYAPAASDDVQRLATQTRITRPNFDATTGELDTDALEVSGETIPSPFAMYADIRSFVQSNDGNRLREQSDPFDMFASALLARTPIRWNMSPSLDAIATLVTRHAPQAKTVVLVQSYNEATALGDLLVSDHGLDDECLTVLESSRDDRHDKITTYNDREGGVIIGPGDLLGVGINMPDAEIAVNVARGGVNASLVQRIGRVLRNPEGDKEAMFYHVVPQPTLDDALHDVEDGAQLLRGAAEYQRLGETFKEPPSFVASDPAIEGTIVDLEDAGVKLLERVEDTSVLVAERKAREHIRRLQSQIYDTKPQEGRRDQSVITSYGDVVAGDPGTAEDDRSGRFPERNEAYEQYRLALGPYRAAKGTSSNYLDATVQERETDEGYHVDLPPEYEGTAFHNEFERWLNEYHGWRTQCDNRDGTGEPGSLPEYKEHWPAPRESEGAMLTSEAAAEIGIDYASSDPIFFPQTDDGVYVLPLPDGRQLTVDGIVEEDSDEPGPAGEEYAFSLVILKVARDAVAGRDDNLQSFLTEAVRDVLKQWVDGESLPPAAPERTPRKTVRLDLPDKYEKLLALVVEDADADFSSPSEVLEAAACAALDIDLGGYETYSITLQRDTAVIVERLVEQSDEYDSVEDLIENTVTREAREEF